MVPITVWHYSSQCGPPTWHHHSVTHLGDGDRASVLWISSLCDCCFFNEGVWSSMLPMCAMNRKSELFSIKEPLFSLVLLIKSLRMRKLLEIPADLWYLRCKGRQKLERKRGCVKWQRHLERRYRLFLEESLVVDPKYMSPVLRPRIWLAVCGDTGWFLTQSEAVREEI